MISRPISHPWLNLVSLFSSLQDGVDSKLERIGSVLSGYSAASDGGINALSQNNPKRFGEK